MSNIIKKTIFLLPLIFIASSCGSKKNDSLVYELKANDTYMVSLKEGSTEKKVSIPKKYNNKAITEISGFRNNSYIEVVSFQGNITNIESGTFSFCENLKEINVSNSKYYKSIGGNLYKDDELIVYASGRTTTTFEIDKNICSKAFTVAPNLRKVIINSNRVDNKAFFYVERLEEVYIGTKTITLDDNFIEGIKPEKLIVNNEKILKNSNIKGFDKVYVVKDAELSISFLENYNYVKDEMIDGINYSKYEVK